MRLLHPIFKSLSKNNHKTLYKMYDMHWRYVLVFSLWSGAMLLSRFGCYHMLSNFGISIKKKSGNGSSLVPTVLLSRLLPHSLIDLSHLSFSKNWKLHNVILPPDNRKRVCRRLWNWTLIDLYFPDRWW